VELRQVKSVELTELNYMTALFEFGRAQGRLGGAGNMLRRTYIIKQFIKCLSSQSAEEVTLSCINRDRSEYLRAPKASESRRIERARTDEKPKIG
jgi:hypothetical protein